MNLLIDIRLQKIIRDMWGNKPRLLLVVLSIAVGVFTVGTLTRTQAIISREFRNAYIISNPAQVIINMGRGFDDDMVDSIAGMPEVIIAEGRYWQGARVQLSESNWGEIDIHLRTDYDDLRVHKVWPLQGTWPPPERTILIERSSLDLLNIDIGDTITVDMRNGIRRNLTVSGVVHDIDQVPTSFVNLTYGYVTSETFDWLLGQTVPYDSLQLTVSPDQPDEDEVRQVLPRIERKLKNSGFTNYNIEIASGTHELDEVVQAILFVLVTVGLLSMVFSAFLVVNIISAVLARQIAQVGVMKTLGMQSRQVMVLYFGQIFVSGLLALIIALPFSIFAAQRLCFFLGDLLNFDIVDLSVPWYVYSAEIFAGLVMPLLAGAIPVLTGTRITVREAVAHAGGGGGQFGASKIDQLFKRVTRLPEPLLYAFRNILRQKARLAFTLFTLVLAGAMFISVIGTRASLLLTVDNLAAYWQQDVTLRIGETRLEKARREALRIPGVVAVEGRLSTRGPRIRANGEESNRHIVFGVVPDSPFLKPQVREGRWLQPDDTNALVINLPLLREEPDISIGDTVEFVINDQSLSGSVVGIVTGQAVGASRFMDPIVYVNYEHLAGVMGMTGRIDRVLIQTEQSDPAFQTQIANAVDSHYLQTGVNVGQKETNNSRRMLVSNIFGVLLSVLFVLAVLFVIVGAMSLTGMMSLSVLERTVEIGIIRAIGGAGHFVAQIVMVEGLFIGLLSWILGVLLALPLSRFLSNTIGNIILSTPLDYTFSWLGVLLWLVIALTISAIAAFIPARNASQLSVRETLSYE